MGFFLVFFPEDQQQKQQQQQQNSPSLATTLSPILKRTNSNHIFTRTQSTISICAVLIFLTLILFTLSSFEPNNDFLNHHRRRLLTNSNFNNICHNLKHKPPALQGLGTLYTRGTTAMHNLVLCHVSDHVTTKELKTFLRGYYFLSGLASKSDLLFMFDSISTVDSFDDVILQESDGYLKYLSRVGSDPTRAVKTGQDSDKGEPIWGKRLKMSSNSSELTRPSYGSVVGFGVNEFDPENSLSGFMDHAPIYLRRWAAYPMILGRVKRKFKHIILLDVNKVLLLGDPLTRVKSHSPESIFLSSQKNEKTHRKSHRKSINPAVVIGGERGVRRLSAAMLTEIVRSTTRQHGKKKGALTETGLLSQLVGNEYLQKSIKFFMMSELIQEPSSLSGLEIANLTVVKSGDCNLDIGEIIMKHICSFSIDASFYTDCYSK